MDLGETVEKNLIFCNVPQHIPRLVATWWSGEVLQGRSRQQGVGTAMAVPVSGKRSGHRERQGQQEETGGVGEEERR